MTNQSNNNNGQAQVLLPPQMTVMPGLPSAGQVRAPGETMQEAKQFIPDAQGTVQVKGYEEDVQRYFHTSKYLEIVKADVEKAKVQFRKITKDVLSSTIGTVSRVVLRGEATNNVMVSLPDLSSKGNRLLVNDKKKKELEKLGGIEALGIPEAELFDTTTTVTLKGDWVPWFLNLFNELVRAGRASEAARTSGLVNVETTRRLKLDAIIKLKEMAKGQGATADVAAALLDQGIKDFTIAIKE